MKKLQKSHGFSTVEIVIVFLVLAIIGFSGFLVFKHNHKAANSSSSPTTSKTSAKPDTSSNQPAQTAQQYMVISEWGVQLTLDSTTSSLYYYIKPNLPNVVYLSLKTVSNIAPKCAADQLSLGAISRLTSEEHNAALNDPSKGTPGIIPIGSYWFGFTSPQAGCLQSVEERAAVQQALPNFNLGSVSKAFNTISTVD